ncbi:MAG: pyridoxal-phosphate dependent enzyme [Anaerolineales bacterium]|jgi:threonine dehydratase
MTTIPSQWLVEASKRITSHIHHTPMQYDSQLGTYLKWENRQLTGSFKVRGALNKILSLSEREKERGLVTASAGNHGQGVALAGGLIGAQVVIFACEHAVPAKVEAMRSYGAEVRLVPGGYGDAEQAGLNFACQNEMTWISPYNDGKIIAGQGTLAMEVLHQLPTQGEFTWIVPVGGGGLLSGIGLALKADKNASRRHKLVGVQSKASPFMHTLYYRGTQEGVVELPSLADGLAGPVEEGSITIPLVRRLADQMVLVEEEQIARAVRYAWERYNQKLEGSAAAALAAVLSKTVVGQPAVIILSGGNIQPETFQQIL